jgi:glycerophosphoryl diester phosphodiesterase
MARSRSFYVLVVGAMQLLLIVIAIPVIRLLYQLVLVETGLGTMAYDRISHVLRNPLADVTLLIIAIVAVIAIMASCHVIRIWPSTTKTATRHRSGCAAAGLGHDQEVGHPQGLLMIIYLILLLPLGQLGLTSILTKKVRYPIHQRGADKNPATSLLYSAVLLVISYVNVRLIFTLPLLGTTSAGVWQAFVTSWRLTRWRCSSARRPARSAPFLAAAAPPSFWAVVTLAPTIATDLLAPSDRRGWPQSN